MRTKLITEVHKKGPDQCNIFDHFGMETIKKPICIQEGLATGAIIKSVVKVGESGEREASCIISASHSNEVWVKD